jgi:anti-sigma factor RsiW
MRGKGKLMNCTDALPLVPLYLTEELDPTRAELFSAHLKTCPACAREMEQQMACDSLLRASVLNDPVDSARIERHVRRRISRGSTPRIPQRWIFASAGMAAALIAVLAYTAIFLPRTMPVDSAAARDHRLEMIDRQPRKWLMDRASIEQLAEQQGLSGAMIGAIAPAGYRLDQGKLCKLDGRVFLHLVYTKGNANFSVFLHNARAIAGGKPIFTTTFGTEHIARFDARGLSALIVTEQPSDAALDLARHATAIL